MPSVYNNSKQISSTLLKKKFVGFLLGVTLAAGIGLGFLLHFQGSLAASAPNILPYQGRLLNDNGVPVADLSLDFQFRIYDAVGGGTCLWSNASSTCAANADQVVPLTDGLFTENLGDTADGYAAILDATFANNTDLFLEVQIEGEVLSPRKRIGAAGFAMNADTLDGMDSTDFLTAGNTFIQDGNSFGATATLGTNDTFDLEFETDGTTRATILATGELGIGTTSPIARFHLSGGDSWITNDTLTGSIITVAGNGATDRPYFLLERARGAIAAPTAVLSGDILGDFVWNGQTGAGFGTTATAAQLRVEATENWAPGSNGSRFVLQNKPNGDFTLVTRMVIDQNGNVGIGSNTTPEALLSLGTAGQLSFEGATNNGFETFLTVVDPTADNTITFQNASGTVAFLSDVAGSSGWTDGGTSVTLTTSTDNVGVGGSPLGKMSVNGDTNEITFLVQGASLQTANTFVVEANATNDLFVVDATGLVGIGTSTPAHLLDIVSGSNPTTLNLQNSDSGENTRMRINAGGRIAEWGMNLPSVTSGTFPNELLGFSSGNDTYDFKMLVRGSGGGVFDAGIAFGTGNPGSGNPPTERLRIGEDNASTGKLRINRPMADYDTVISGDTVSDLFVVDASTDRVGIGTATPEALLAIGEDGLVSLEGATADGFETFLTVTDPTADNTITFPNASGTVALVTTTDLDAVYDNDSDKQLDVDSTSGLTFDLTTTGDVIFEDGGTTFATFNDSGNVSFENTVTIGSTNADLVLFNAEVDTHFIPNTDDTYDLGSDTNRWRDLYLGPATLHIGVTADESLISFSTASNLLTFQNSADSATGFQFLDADGGTPVVNVDTTNERLGVGTAAPAAKLQVTLAAASDIGTIVKAAASQTANLTEWRNSSDSILTRIDSGGNVVTGVDYLAASAASGSSTTEINDITGETNAPQIQSITLVPSDGLPVLAYMASGSQLKTRKCTTANCSTFAAAITLDSSANGAANLSGTLASDGFPVFVYRDSGLDLKVAHCTDISCTSANTNVIVTGSNTAGSTSVSTQADGSLNIAYVDNSITDIFYVRCANPTAATPCSTISTPVNMSTTDGSSIHDPEVEISTDGFPIVFFGNGFGNVTAVKCADADCLLGGQSVTVVGGFGSPTEAERLPGGEIALTSTSGSTVYYTKCTNASCSTSSNVTLSDLTFSSCRGHDVDLVIRSGLPIIGDTHDGSSCGQGDEVSRIYQCGNDTCSSGNTGPTVIDTGTTAFDTGGAPGGSMSLNPTGDLIMQIFGDAGGPLRVARVLLSSVVFTGTDVGSSSVRLANGYFSGELKVGALTIDGASPNGYLSVAGDITPATNDTYDLGSDALRWQDLFLGPATLHIGTSTTDEGTFAYDTSANALVVNEGGMDTDFRIEGDTDANLFFADAGNSRIGIGTASPSTLLDVVGGDIHQRHDTSADSFLTYENQGGGRELLTLATTDQTTYIQAIPSTAPVSAFRLNTSSVDALGGDLLLGTLSSGKKITFYTGGDVSGFERMTIDGSGNVGIGTTTPSGKLSVAGNVTINASVPAAHTSSGYNALWFPNNSAVMPEDASEALYLTTNTARSSGSGWVQPNPSNPSWSVGLGLPGDVWYVSRTPAGGDPDTPSFLLWLDNAGQLGIGTTSPSRTLDVAGSFRYTGNGTLGDATTDTHDITGSTTITGPTSGSLLPLTVSGNSLVDGLINTTLLLTRDTTDSDTSISFKNGDGGSASTKWSLNLRGTTDQGGTTDDYRFNLYDVGSTAEDGINAPRLTVLRGGNVGIMDRGGGSDLLPSAQLHVTQASSADAFRVDDAVGDSTPFLIDASGNVGIGATNPEGILDISTDGSASISYLQSYGSGAGTYPLLNLVRGRGTRASPSPAQSGDILGEFAAGGQYNTSFGSSNASAVIQAKATELFTPTANGTSLNFLTSTNGTAVPASRMFIDGLGNVGIGTTGPTEELHVQKDQNSLTRVRVENATAGTGAAAEAVFVNDSVAATVTGITSSAYTATDAILSGGNVSYFIANSTADTMNIGTQGADPLRLFTNLTERLTILSTGNIGIGDSATSPTAQLHVIQTDSADAFRVDDAASDTTPFVIDQLGNVALGGTSAGTTLDIQRPSGDGSAELSLRSGAAPSLVSVRTFGGSGESTLRLSRSAGTDITTPAAVGDGFTGGSVQFQAYGDTSYGSIAGIDALTDGNQSDTNHGGNMRFYTTPNGSTTLTERLSILSNGNVGIGDAAPDSLFEVESATTATARITSTGTDTDPELEFSLSDSGAAAFTMGVDDSDSDSFKISSGGDLGTTDRLTITSAGNVGIATSTPNNLLTVDSNGSASAPTIAFDTSDSNTGIFHPGNDTLGFATSGIERLTIESGGQVGVGETSPSAFADRLTVSDTGAVTVDHRNFWSREVTTNTTTDGIFKIGALIESSGTFTGSGGAATIAYGTVTAASGADTNISLYAYDSRVQIDDNSSPNTPGLATGAGDLYVVNDIEADGNIQLNLNEGASGEAVCGQTDGGGGNEVLESCGAAPAADYMEMYPVAASVVRGTLVMAGTNPVTTNAGDTVAELVPTVVPYQTNMIGIMSDPEDAGDFNSIGYNIPESANPQPIALKGRVLARVNAENGAIAVGDPITSSSIPGVGMKATDAGSIIGYALEASSGNGEELVMVFLALNYYPGDGSTAPTAGTDNQASGFGTGGTANFTSLNMDGDIFMHGHNIIDVGEISGLANAWKIEADGTMRTSASFVAVIESYQGEDVETYAVLGREQKITLDGTATIENGTATVLFEDVDASFNDVISTTAEVRVVTTPRGPVFLYVTAADHDGFTVQQINGSDSGVAFDWIVTAYRKDHEPAPVVEEPAPVVEEPPVEETPPAEEPPAETPPAEEPPVVEEPPAETPPTEAPPAEETPPAEEVPPTP